MKRRKLLILVGILTFGMLTTAFGVAPITYTPITSVTITNQLADGDFVLAEQDYRLYCTAATDQDKCWNPSTSSWYVVTDDVTHTWSGPGTFTPNTGESGVVWTAPNVIGSKTILVTASDTPIADDTSHPTDSIDVTVVKLDKLEYDDPYDEPDAGWIEVTGTIEVYKDDEVDFRIVTDSASATLPDGITWDIEHANVLAGDSDKERTIQFEEASCSDTDILTLEIEFGLGTGAILQADVLVKPIQTIVASLNGQDLWGIITEPSMGNAVEGESWWNTSDEDEYEYEDYLTKAFEEDADWSSPTAHGWIDGHVVRDSSGDVRNKIIVMGFSNGADGARKVAGYLDGLGIDVDLLFLLDAIGKPWHVGPNGTESILGTVSSVRNIRQVVDPFWTIISPLFKLQGYQTTGFETWTPPVTTPPSPFYTDMLAAHLAMPDEHVAEVTIEVDALVPD